MTRLSPTGPDERKRSSSGKIKGLAAVLLILILSCPGCRLAYIFHAAAGQYRLLHDSVPVDEALKDERLGPEAKARLRLVARVKDFGERELGLKPTQNYQTVYLKTGRGPVYCISASPKDRLERVTWWFPVVGDMPYLGFFDLNRARAKKERLEKKDLDVTMGVADAYSTLGWFRDPVTLNLIQGSTVDLVETLLHEMTHVTLYLMGQGEFNEGLAVLVGKLGALRFLKKNFGPSDPLTVEAEDAVKDERLFCTFLSSLIQKLEAFYNSGLSYRQKLEKREKAFSDAVDAFGRLKAEFKTERYAGFGSAGLNNAYLMSVGLYHRHFHLFESALKRHGDSLKETISFFKELAKKDANMLAETRKWLKSAP